MKRFSYSEEQLDFIEQGYKKWGLEELTQNFNAEFQLDKTVSAIRGVTRAKKFKSGRTSGDLLKGKSKVFTEAQVEFIKSGYRSMTLAELTAAFAKAFPETPATEKRIRAFTRNHKILSGRSGHFEKGRIPWTAGKAGTGILKANAGSFKKGSTPANRNPLYSERKRVDGYLEIKVPERNPFTGAPTRYRLKHQWVWEQVNGPIQDGQILRFKDGNRENCDIDNLELMDRGLHAHLNKAGYNDAPVELKRTIKLMCQVRQAVRAAELPTSTPLKAPEGRK